MNFLEESNYLFFAIFFDVEKIFAEAGEIFSVLAGRPPVTEPDPSGF